MRLEDLDKEDSWSVTSPILGAGWHDVEIDSAKEGESKNGHPQLELQMSNAQGEIRDWIVLIEATRGKIKSVIEAAGIAVQSGDWDFQPSALVGKTVSIRVDIEPSFKDPNKMQSRVQGYVAVGKSADGAKADDDIPF